MIRNKLVDGMNTYGEMALGRMCEDCIFGKHTSHLYNSTVVKERDLLEHIHIDLWGLVMGIKRFDHETKVKARSER